VIYLDYQATTPLAPEARAAMLPWLAGPEAMGFANPTAPTAQAARQRRRSRWRVGKWRGCFRPVAG
jgi:cysteine sulfinate desulfinase/cysteine desulfurase-like protein